MISVVIPTLNAETTLAATLSALVPAAVEGLVREVIVADGGSTDRTAQLVEHAGAHFLARSGGRGHQLAAGAARARFPWLLFLHADTVLQPGWENEASTFMDRVDAGTRPPAAAAFRFVLDDMGVRPRILEMLVAVRCALLRLPYGDQALLIPKHLYDAAGGYRPLPLMEDVDLIRRLGRRRVAMLRSPAVTSAVRYQRDGYALRTARNLACLSMYFLRVPPQFISRVYEGKASRARAGGFKSP